MTVAYRKRAIPSATRVAVALAHGAVPGETTPAACTYCGAPGSIHWPKVSSGRPGRWVHFAGLELDHVKPEYHGGEATPDNVTLACRPCNRRKGHRWLG